MNKNDHNCNKRECKDCTRCLCRCDICQQIKDDNLSKHCIQCNCLDDRLSCQCSCSVCSNQKGIILKRDRNDLESSDYWSNHCYNCRCLIKHSPCQCKCDDCRHSFGCGCPNNDCRNICGYYDNFVDHDDYNNDDFDRLILIY